MKNSFSPDVSYDFPAEIPYVVLTRKKMKGDYIVVDEVLPESTWTAKVFFDEESLKTAIIQLESNKKHYVIIKNGSKVTVNMKIEVELS